MLLGLGHVKTQYLTGFKANLIIRLIMDVGTAASSLKERGICLSRVDWGGEKMESPPRLGLGIINIAPLLGRTDLTTRVWVWNLGTDLGMC